MLRPTLKKLNSLLADEDLPFHSVVNPITKNQCETYGRKTMAYFRCQNMVQRRRIEDLLEAAGCKVNRIYWTKEGRANEDAPYVEVEVSYLRAHGWRD